MCPEVRDVLEIVVYWLGVVGSVTLLAAAIVAMVGATDEITLNGGRVVRRIERKYAIAALVLALIGAESLALSSSLNLPDGWDDGHVYAALVLNIATAVLLLAVLIPLHKKFKRRAEAKSPALDKSGSKL